MSYYLIIVDKVADFIRQELITELYVNEEDAQLRFWSLISETKKHLPEVSEDDDEELVEEKENGMWQVYFSGDWAFYHSQVIIRKVSLKLENKDGKE